MKTRFLLSAICLPTLVSAGEPIAAADASAPVLATQNVRSAKRVSNVFPAPAAGKKTPVLPPRPPLPEGVTDIAFDDFFKMPVGPLGLEFTDKLKALQGKKVRLAGFQVAEMVGVCNAEADARSEERKAHAMLEASVPGRLMLVPMPESVNMSHTGLCEDLPPQVAFVTVPEFAGKNLPHHEGPLLLTGTVDLGNKPEPDGRVSAVRVQLDPAPATASNSATAPSHLAVPTQQPNANISTK